MATDSELNKSTFERKTSPLRSDWSEAVIPTVKLTLLVEGSKIEDGDCVIDYYLNILDKSAPISKPKSSSIFVMLAGRDNGDIVHIVRVNTGSRRQKLKVSLLSFLKYFGREDITFNLFVVVDGSEIKSNTFSISLPYSDELDFLFRDAPLATIEDLRSSFNEGSSYFEIDNPLRKAHFFAQVLQEVGRNFRMKPLESMSYPSEALKKGWWFSEGDPKNWVKGNNEKNIGGYFTKGKKSICKLDYFRKKENHPIADLYGRKDLNAYDDKGVQKAVPTMLANHAYSNKYENGDVDSEDGNNYRGKGILQLTWKENYRKTQEVLGKFDSKIDIVKNPLSVKDDMRIAVLSAMAFWKWNNINRKIGTDKSEKIVNKVSDVINREDGEGRKKRIEFFRETSAIFRVK